MNNYMINRLPTIFPTALSAMPDFVDFFNEIDNMMSKPFIKKVFPYPVNVYNNIDKEGKVVSTVIEVALAGFSKEEISVKARKGKTLTLTLNPADECEEAVKYKKEIFKGIAKRSAELVWELNPKLDCNNLKITFVNGLLTIVLPIIKEVEEDNEIIGNIE